MAGSGAFASSESSLKKGTTTLKNLHRPASRREAIAGDRSQLTRAMLAVTSMLVTAGGSFAASGYTKNVLVTDQTGFAPFTDSRLVNPWGLTGSLDGSFYVADNDRG